MGLSVAANVIIQIILVELQLRVVDLDLHLHLVEAFLPDAGGLPARATLGERAVQRWHLRPTVPLLSAVSRGEKSGLAFLWVLKFHTP